MNFSRKNRPYFIQQIASRPFDLLIIGGGITGCGMALDAALRGLKVALVEKEDFASGTSSRSTKLIHGGLRYLKQLELSLVHHTGRERAVVYKNARHLVIPEKMLLPIVEGGSLGKQAVSAALLAYDFLAGIRRKEHRRMLDKKQAAAAEPLLRTDILKGGGLYYEYRTDDARLTIEIAKSAYKEGALLLNYIEVVDFRYDDKNQINGVIAKDTLTGECVSIHATVVVNATGPWVDLLRQKDNSLYGKRLQLTKGVHIVIPFDKLPLQQAVYFDTGDGRMIFAIPRGHKTYIGTTDTVYNQDINRPTCDKKDAQYLLDAVNSTFNIIPLKLQDIESSWAGLRPLIFEEGKSPADISRKDEIIESPTGLISIAGGKLTGYRLMAEKAVNRAVLKSGGLFKDCSTRSYRLSGGDFNSDADLKKSLDGFIAIGMEKALPIDLICNWFYRYGKNTEILLRDDASPEEAEFRYCLDHEMVTHLSDYLIRRTGKLYFDRIKSEILIDKIAETMRREFSISNEIIVKMKTETVEQYQLAVRFVNS